MEDFERHGKHMFLSTSTAEDVIQKSLEYIRLKTWDDSRGVAWDDCTNYFKEVIAKIVNSNESSDSKIEVIRVRFGIPPQEDK